MNNTQLIDLTGRRFGFWVVVARLPNRGEKAIWRCRCDCGTERAVTGNELRRGGSRSCGCLRAWLACIRRTHGLSGSRTYSSWRAMRRRCGSPKSWDFHHYGRRGIHVDPRWERFEQFYSDMGERPPEHTLDRIDVDGGYGPANCQWAPAATQRRNQRPRTRNRRPRAQWTAAIEAAVLEAHARDAARLAEAAAR